jgi:hypothetical protein
MKDKELNLEEIETSHTRWIGGRSCSEERKWRKYLCFVYLERTDKTCDER